VLLVRKNGEVTFIERDVWCLDPDDNEKPIFKADNHRAERVFRFKLDVKSSLENK